MGHAQITRFVMFPSQDSSTSLHAAATSNGGDRTAFQPHVRLRMAAGGVGAWSFWHQVVIKVLGLGGR